MTGLTHRLRGHTLRRETRHVDTSTYIDPVSRDGCIVESGRIDHLLICSCGETWRTDW